MDIDNAHLKRLLLEELEVLDYDMDPILNRLMTMISVSKDPLQIQRWKERNPALVKTYTTDMIVSSAILVRMFLMIIIKYCLITYHIGDRIFVDENATELNFYTTYTIREELFQIGSPEFFFFSFYPLEMIDAYARQHLLRLIRMIAETCNVFSANDVRIIKLEKESDTHISLGKQIIHPQEALGVRYRLTWIDSTLISNRDEYRKLCSVARSLSSLYADPIVNYSPTGSDSFVSAHGLFSCMLFNQWIDTSTTICDLTAGRGDGHLAADLLNLKMTSYSRDDIFNKINRVEGVILIPNLDVTDQKTLLFTLAFDHIHIDLSHFKGDGSKLIDTIIFFQNASKTITIRLNGLFGEDMNLEPVLARTDYETKICYPFQSTLKPYQMYLCLRPCNYDELPQVDDILESELFKRLSMNYYSIARMNNLYVDNVEAYHNSAIEAISLDMNYETMIEQLTTEHSGHQVLTRYQKIIRNWSNVQTIDLVPTQLPTKVAEQLSSDDILLGSNVSSLRVAFYQSFPSNEKNLGYKPTQARYKKLDQHLTSLKRGADSLWSKDLSMLTKNELIIIRSYHPLQEVRTTINAIIEMIDSDADPRSKHLDELIEEKLEYQKTIEGTSNAWSLNFKKALMALCIAVSANDYNTGITYLLQEYFGDKSHRAKAQVSLEIYRKLGALYLSLKSTYYLSLTTIRSLHKIISEFRKATATRHVHEREQHPQYLDLLNNDDKLEFPDSFFENIAMSIINNSTIGNLIAVDSFLDTHLGLSDPVENISEAINLTMEGMNDMLQLDDFAQMMNDRVNELDYGEDRLDELMGDWF
jgi:hypothetical protein